MQQRCRQLIMVGELSLGAGMQSRQGCHLQVPTGYHPSIGPGDWLWSIAQALSGHFPCSVSYTNILSARDRLR